MKNLLQRIEDTEKKYYINHPKATETDSMVYVLKTLKDDSIDSILTCYQFLDRIKNAKKIFNLLALILMIKIDKNN